MPQFSGGFSRQINETLGCQVPAGPGGFGLDYRRFYATVELRDVLDSLTIAFDELALRNRSPASRWCIAVSAMFEEEHVAYRIDDDGVVHPFVDSEFEINHRTALAALAASHFGGAQHEFDEAFRHLRNSEGKQAIRMMFPAVETAAKILLPGKFTTFASNEVDRHLRPRLQTKYAGNKRALDAGGQMLGAFKNWIQASRQYRHGAEVSEPSEPPVDFVVAYLSAGAMFLRWMIELFE